MNHTLIQYSRVWHVLQLKWRKWFRLEIEDVLTALVAHFLGGSWQQKKGWQLYTLHVFEGLANRIVVAKISYPHFLCEHDLGDSHPSNSYCYHHQFLIFLQVSKFWNQSSLAPVIAVLLSPINHDLSFVFITLLQSHIEMGVSWNTHKSSVLIGFSLINHPFWDTPHVWTPPNGFVWEWLISPNPSKSSKKIQNIFP